MLNHFELSIILPAFLAGLIVLATHVPLGIEVLKRGIIFIDLAIAQIAGLGALAALLFFDEHTKYLNIIIQLCSLGAAFLGALFLNWSGKNFPHIQEALIGCLFVFCASLALLLLSQNPHGGEHMKDMLAGQILWVTLPQIIMASIVYFLVIILLLTKQFFKKQGKDIFGHIGFYILFALTITVSVQLVGVYMVFASLVLPAIASLGLTGKKRLIIGYVVGVIGLVMGLLLSMQFDLATGPTIICCLFIIVVIKLLRDLANAKA